MCFIIILLPFKPVFASRLDFQCEGVEFEMNHLFPAFSAEHAECGLQQDPLLFSCAGSSAKYQRLCPCRDYRNGQVALCRDCLWPRGGPVDGEQGPGCLLRLSLLSNSNNDSAPLPLTKGAGCQSRYNLSGNCMIVLWMGRVRGLSLKGLHGCIRTTVFTEVMLKCAKWWIS